MNKIILIVTFFVGVFGMAQDVEDRDDSFIIESNKNLLKINIKEPFYQVKPSSCTSFQSASYETGVQSYKNVLLDGMYRYLNSEFYTLEGDFTFTLHIDKTGRVIDVVGTPKVSNSQVFFEDMKYVVRRIKKAWIPVTCNGEAVDSKMKIQMSFSSLTVDV